MILENITEVCKKCRSCCTATDIRVCEEDIERWKKQDRLDILLAINPLLGDSRQLIRKKSIDECIFLTEEGTCKIHETKPRVCILFPNNRRHSQDFCCKAIDIFFPK